MSELKNQTLAFIGCGTMGEAIIRGLIASKKVSPDQIIATDTRPDHLEALRERHKIRTSGDNLAATKEATVVLLCVKPYLVGAVLAASGMSHAIQGKLVISIAAGFDLQQLELSAPGSAPVRAMPNMAARIREAMTFVARGPDVSDDQVAIAVAIFSAVGRCLEIDERHMDVCTALGGSAPAFALLVIEALADGGVLMGLPRNVATTVAAQVLQGAGRIVLESGTHPAALKDAVTTPGGSTIAGLMALEDAGVRSAFARAIEEATRVAGGLGK